MYRLLVGAIWQESFQHFPFLVECFYYDYYDDCDSYYLNICRRGRVAASEDFVGAVGFSAFYTGGSFSVRAGIWAYASRVLATADDLQIAAVIWPI